MGYNNNKTLHLKCKFCRRSARMDSYRGWGYSKGGTDTNGKTLSALRFSDGTFPGDEDCLCI